MCGPRYASRLVQTSYSRMRVGSVDSASIVMPRQSGSVARTVAMSAEGHRPSRNASIIVTERSGSGLPGFAASAAPR